MDIAQWKNALVKGKIVGCIRGKEPADRVAKYVRTLLKYRYVPTDLLDRVLPEIERESVQPFVGYPWYQPERHYRFEELLEALRKR